MKLSNPQIIVLWMSPCYVHGPEVRTARALERLGLGLLEDNGRLAHDSARWHFTANEAGKAKLASITTEQCVAASKQKRAYMTR